MFDSDEDDGIPSRANSRRESVQNIKEFTEKTATSSNCGKVEKIPEKLLKKRQVERKMNPIRIPPPKKRHKATHKIKQSQKRKAPSHHESNKLLSKPRYVIKTYSFEIPRTKHELVREILKRWWYCLPDWPPKDIDYSEKLVKNQLYLTTKEEFRISPELNVNGQNKVFAIPGYKGLFRDSQGELIDLRDKELCPSFDNLKTFKVSRLANLLIEALKQQLNALKTVDHYDQVLEKELVRFSSKIKVAYKKLING